MEINKNTVGDIIKNARQETNGVVKEDYTKILNIKLRDPDIEYRSSITGITMDGEICNIEGYLDFASLFECYFAKRNRMELKFNNK